jgi:hypothetical protein
LRWPSRLPVAPPALGIPIIVPSFRPLPQPANNQALVYVYSRDLPLGKTFTVLANGKPVTSDMAYGKFFCFQADPGEMRIASKGHLTGFETPLLLAYYGAVEARKLERVVFTVQAGETYFVDMHNGFARETMTLVSKDKGERKIQNCRRIDAASIQ